MLTSRLAELEKRDRIKAKGTDGGSFIPSAVLITGTTKNAATMSIQLPRYINIDNLLNYSLLVDEKSDANGIWYNLSLSTEVDSAITVAYITDDNTLSLSSITSAFRDTKFRLTVFYKG